MREAIRLKLKASPRIMVGVVIRTLPLESDPHACKGRVWPSKVPQAQTATSPGSWPTLPTAQVWLPHLLVPHSAVLQTSDCPAAGLGMASLDQASHITTALSTPSAAAGLGSDVAIPPTHWSLTLAFWPGMDSFPWPRNTQPRVYTG